MPRDAPRGNVTVSLPVYPGATPLKPFVGTPFPEGSFDPYLQTASIEYRSDPAPPGGERWFTTAFHACGWLSRGFWSSNLTPFSHGLTFESKVNSNLSVEVSLGSAPSGGIYIAYGVEEIIYPPRPAGSYLHGAFVELRLAVQHDAYRSGRISTTVTHVNVLDRSAIRRIVGAIDSIKTYHPITSICPGGPGGPPPPIQPVWLSFIRPNGTIVHAFADGSGGACGGGFAVNGVRWLIEGVSAWNQVLALAAGGRG